MHHARPCEIQAAGRLTENSYRVDGFLDGPGSSGYADELRDAEARAEKAALMVAVDQSDHVLGTVTWCPVESPYRELATRPDQGEFRMLAVDPGARRRGVAAALVRWCIERARLDGMEEVLLCSLPQMTTAHRLYERFGFGREPTLDWQPVPGVTLMAFRLPLTTSIAS